MLPASSSCALLASQPPPVWPVSLHLPSQSSPACTAGSPSAHLQEPGARFLLSYQHGALKLCPLRTVPLPWGVCGPRWHPPDSQGAPSALKQPLVRPCSASPISSGLCIPLMGRITPRKSSLPMGPVERQRRAEEMCKWRTKMKGTKGPKRDRGKSIPCKGPLSRGGTSPHWTQYAHGHTISPPDRKHVSPQHTGTRPLRCSELTVTLCRDGPQLPPWDVRV